LPDLKLLVEGSHLKCTCCIPIASPQKMKLSVGMAALAVALCLGASLVAANDLTVYATVKDCNGK
jgi:hypothetical protein